MTHPRRVVGLRKMLDLNARAFVGVATELRDIQRITGSIEKQTVVPGDDDYAILKAHLGGLKTALQAIGATLAMKSVSRLEAKLDETPRVIPYSAVVTMMSEIEGRFADQLDEIMLFVCSRDEMVFLQGANELLESDNFSIFFPNGALEIEEAAKCVVFGRHTASVFHSMRALEVGIRALAVSLNIDDPIKPADKNWHKMLAAIRSKIDSLYPVSGRLKGTKGAELDSLYATLDAVRIPWRNATMHVENVYLPHEAVHILRCTGFFMTKLFDHCDEEGQPTEEARALL